MVMILSALNGCASRPVPAVDQRLIALGQERGASAEQLRRGRELLVTACAYCHTPVYPTSISMERWDKALPRMIEKAQLHAADEADIRAYIIAARATEGGSSH